MTRTQEAISKFYVDIFELDGKDREKTIFTKADVGLKGCWKPESLCTKVTVHTLRSVIKKWKPGTSSCDGVTAEVWTALPGVALKFLGRRLHEDTERAGPHRGVDRSKCLPDPDDTSTERVEIIPPSVELSFGAEAMGIHEDGTSAKTEFKTVQTAFV